MAEIKTERLDGYRRLVDIARDLASTLDLDILLARIVHAAAEVSGAEAASILLYDDASKQLYFEVATHIDEPTRRGIVVPLEGSIAGWIVSHRAPLRIAHAREDPRFSGEVLEEGGFDTDSVLGVPLITKNKIVGVLEALNKHKGKFTDGDESMLSVLGAQAAVAIENARLFQQSDLISEFVHELRTPLSSLSTATYLLNRPEMSREQHDQITRSIQTEAMRLTALASSFLDLARLESGRIQYRKTAFDLPELMRECRDVMFSKALEENIDIRVKASEGLPPLEADRDKLKQVLLNLISNAVKYNRPNGTVTLGAEARESEMLITVQDTGLGIPEEAMSHLFEKFFRVREHESKAPGTGLGLSICRQIVAGHDGRIEVRSQIGAGSVFSVYLPRHSSTRPARSRR
jgi:signal transduction histidine kinase